MITDIPLQGDWSPAYFMKRQGDHKVWLENCETGDRKPSTVAKFFAEFGRARKDKSIVKVKVR